jgi:hypothetical protein
VLALPEEITGKEGGKQSTDVVQRTTGAKRDKPAVGRALRSLGGLAQTEGEFVGDASYDQGEGDREGRTPSV